MMVRGNCFRWFMVISSVMLTSPKGIYATIYNVNPTGYRALTLTEVCLCCGDTFSRRIIHNGTPSSDISSYEELIASTNITRHPVFLFKHNTLYESLDQVTVSCHKSTVLYEHNCHVGTHYSWLL